MPFWTSAVLCLCLAVLGVSGSQSCPPRTTGVAATLAGPPWAALDYASIDQLSSLPESEHRRLLSLSAVEATAELCSGSLTAVAYATSLLKRVRETECLNAWAALSPSLVLREAAAVDAKRRSGVSAAPLCGLPVGLKDVLDAEGYPTVAGTPALEGHYPPAALESTLVSRLRAAGGIVLGKLRLHELGGGDTTLSPVYGPTLNPHNVTHIVGGSSGGNGAALAAHAAVVALCADSGGSCRSPASLTGTVGFRPSTGCYNAGLGVVGMGAQRDTVGVSARTVGDVQLMHSVLATCPEAEAVPALSQASLAGLKIGRPNVWWSDVGAESLPALDAAMAALEAAGAVIVELDAQPLMELYERTLPDSLFYAAEMPSALAMYLASHNYSTSLQELAASIGTTSTRSWVESFIHGGEAPSPAEYYTAIAEGVPTLRRAWSALFAGVSVIALPTTPLPARPVSDVEPMLDLNGERVAFYEVMGRAFMADCVAGIPGISINAGVSAHLGPYAGGLPVGLMLQAPRFHDSILLAIAAAVEAALPAPPVAPHVPACAGCTAQLGWVRVAYPQSMVRAKASSAAMAYAEDSYVLGFDGRCAAKDNWGLAFPMVSPHAVPGAAVDWSSRQGLWRMDAPAGCEPGAAAAALREAKEEL